MVTRMLKSFCKLKFLSLFMSLMFFAQNGYAQIEAMSKKDFAQKYLPEALSVFGSENPKIMCGTKENLCDVATQVCLKCKTTVYKKVFGIKVLSVINDVGRCVDKSSIKDGDLLSAWPGCTDVNAGGTFLGTGATTSRYLEEASAGFLSESEAKIWGIGKKHKEEFIGSDDKKYMLSVDNENLTIAYGSKGKGCEVLPVKIYNMQTCFFCPMARILFSTANSVTKKSFESFASSFAELIVVIFIVWLAITTLKQVSSFINKKDPSDYIELILKQSFKFIIAYYILLNSSFIFQYFISPVLSSGLKMGEMIQSVELKQPSKKLELSANPMGSGYYNIKLGNGKNLYTHIENYLSSIQSQMAYLQAVGTTLFCVGTKHMIEEFKFLEWGEALGSAFRMMGLGIIFTVVGLLISIVFAFYFLDAIMQLGLLGMVMPLMIAGWPFAITKHLAEKGLGFLLNTFFIFFFTGFVVSVNVVLIDQTLTYSTQIKSENEAVSEDSKSGLNAITTALHNQNPSELATATNIGGVGFLLLIFSSLFGFKFIQQVTPLASKLSDGEIVGGMASQMGGTVASVAKGVTKKATAPITKAAGKAWNNSGGVVGIATGAVSGAVNAVGSVAKIGTKAYKGAANLGRDISKAAGNEKAEKWFGKRADNAGKVNQAIDKGVSKVKAVDKAVKNSVKQ